MRERKKKRWIANFFSSGIGRAVAFIVFLVLVSPVFKAYLRSKEANEMSEGVGQELAELQAKKEFLTAEIARLKTEAGKEEEARKKFNIGRPEEKLLIITDKKEAEGGDKENSGGLWNKIKSWF